MDSFAPISDLSSDNSLDLEESKPCLPERIYSMYVHESHVAFKVQDIQPPGKCESAHDSVHMSFTCSQAKKVTMVNFNFARCCSF